MYIYISCELTCSEEMLASAQGAIRTGQLDPSGNLNKSRYRVLKNIGILPPPTKRQETLTREPYLSLIEINKSDILAPFFPSIIFLQQKSCLENSQPVSMYACISVEVTGHPRS